MTASAVNVNTALIVLTWFGVSPARKQTAARWRPSRRLTHREYPAAPRLLFCADASRTTNSRWVVVAVIGSFRRRRSSAAFPPDVVGWQHPSRAGYRLFLYG